MKADAAEIAARLDALPLGTFRGRDWLVTRSLHADGASEKLVTRVLDGDGYLSANLTPLVVGPRLRPCEMPAARVAAFLDDLVVA